MSILKVNCKANNYVSIYEVDYQSRISLYGKFCGNLKHLKLKTNYNFLIKVEKLKIHIVKLYSFKSKSEFLCESLKFYVIFGFIILTTFFVICIFTIFFVLLKKRNNRKKEYDLHPEVGNPPKYDEIEFDNH